MCLPSAEFQLSKPSFLHILRNFSAISAFPSNGRSASCSVEVRLKNFNLSSQLRPTQWPLCHLSHHALAYCGSLLWRWVWALCLGSGAADEPKQPCAVHKPSPRLKAQRVFSDKWKYYGIGSFLLLLWPAVGCSCRGNGKLHCSDPSD